MDFEANFSGIGFAQQKKLRLDLVSSFGFSS